MGDTIQICDVAARDGLQNHPAPIAAGDKRILIKKLGECGIKTVEATSFVSHKAVPQMADAEEVITINRELPDMRCISLLMNEKGYIRAKEAGTEAVGIVVVCTETLAMKNNRRPLAETIETAKRLVEMAKADGIYTRVYTAASWACPYEGTVPEARVLKICDAIMDMGVDELTLADTIGHATPHQVTSLTTKLVRQFGNQKLSAHFHDTQALGMTNVVAALDAGLRSFDASVGGVGGCPFAPGAAGNLATEDLVFLAHQLGFETGVDLNALWSVVDWLEDIVQKPVGGRTQAYFKSQAQKTSGEPS